jgi:hypothetical protein
MSVSTIASDLLVELSSDEQQFLVGGKSCCGGDTIEPPAPTGVRLVVGKIITMTPFISCSPEGETGEESGTEGAMGSSPEEGSRGLRGRRR